MYSILSAPVHRRLSVGEALRTLAVSSTPASTMRTETLGSSDRREAATQPALPAPTIMSV